MRLFVDPEENNDRQEKRIRMFRAEGSRQTEGRVEITVDVVIRARSDTQPDRANAPETS